MTPDYESAIEVYHRAKEYMREAGLCAEIEWQRSVSMRDISESQFLRESAWVVLCSGFSERTVRSKFDYISLVFCDWESANAILESAPACWISARSAIDHNGKMKAIVEIAQRISDQGFDAFRGDLMLDPISKLEALPFIGPITSWHLAKNLGLDVAKPDRHLARISERLGFMSAHTMCESLSRLVREESRVVDLVIWRYLADNPRSRRHWC